MKRTRCIALLPALLTLTLTLAPASPASAQDLLWTRQTGTVADDQGNGVAVDNAGNAYLSGTTEGSLGGPSAGVADAFLAKYDASGILLWTRLIGTSGWEEGHGVAVDSAGNAYITGHTSGSLGGLNAGNADIFLAKYDALGTLLWTRQTGMPSDDEAFGVAVDSAGNAYITGITTGSLGGPNAGIIDYFLAKYDASGTLLWTRQAGTSTRDYGLGVAVDRSGNATIAGYTEGNLGGPSAGGTDAFLARYDASGTLLWTRQFGASASERGTAVAVDNAGNAYITGNTGSSLGGPHAGRGDIFLAKYDASGNLLWTRQTGTSGPESGTGVAVDSAGNAYISGFTLGSLGGPSAGGWDAFQAKYGASGNLLWARQTGTSANDSGSGVAVDSAGNAYISGFTEGSLGGPNAGRFDIFLAKYGCYADCDTSTGNGVLDLFDFLCFQSSFVNGEPYACDCDTTTGPLVCDLFDFLCFQGAFVGGCP